MIIFTCELRCLPHLRSYLPVNRLLSCPLSSSSSSVSLDSPSNSSNQESFAVNYLINSCGFHLESAISASKRLKFKTPDKPDSVLAFFKNHGFTDTQILDIVKKYPRILTCNPEKSLLPKFEFLSSIGFTSPNIVRVVSVAPKILRYSMEKKIIPSHNFFRDLLQSDERTVSMLKRFPYNLSNQESITVNYLINSCGFHPESALSASKRLKIKTPDKPDSVLAIFKNHGFTNTQILDIVKKYPRILSCKPEKSLLPKFEFFTSIGFTNPDVVRVVSIAPNILRYSLEKRFIPSYNFFRDLLQSDEKTISMLKRFPYLLTYDLGVFVVQNIQILRDEGVPESKIIFFVTYHSRSLRMNTDNFRNLVEDVKEMGFNPSLHTFMWALNALKCMSTLTFEKKVEVYKRWGWSVDDVLVAFKKHPLCLSISEDKITRVMDFFINKMHIKHSLLVNTPILFSLSLEKRVIPRCLFYQVLLDKCLIKKEKDNSSIIGWAGASENTFIKRIRKNFGEESPKLLEIYQEKLNSAN